MTQSENQLLNGMMDLMVQNNFELSIKKEGDNLVFNLVTNLDGKKEPVSLPNENIAKFTYSNENSNEESNVWVHKGFNKNKNVSKGNRKKYFTPYMTFVKLIRDKNPNFSPKQARQVATNVRKEFPEILKFSKNKFYNTIKTLDFNYYK